MENTSHIQPMGAIDQLSQRGARRPGKDEGASHGDVVVEALTGPVRFMIVGVVLANFALGAWFVSRGDFSNVKPQSNAAETLIEAQVEDQENVACTPPAWSGSLPARR